MERYDVAIAGTGMAGSMLALILRRYGHKVLLLDRGTHPRFVVGESTIPQTSAMLRLLAERHQVPEIEAIASFRGVQEKIAPTSGIKRNFGFVHHQENQRQLPHHATQSVITEDPDGPESHLFRQDVDAYLFYHAVRHGADAQLMTAVESVAVEGDGVRIGTSNGREFKARYAVDAGGFESPFARFLKLRSPEDRLKTRSRSSFTHMIGVPGYETSVKDRTYGMPRSFEQGTLHHIFDGGWVWVIPFDNHEGSTNPVCSVGLTIDADRFPRTEQDPNKEFFDFIARFPDVADQFRNAVAVRPWIAAGRTQYSSHRTIGDRICLLGQAAGAIDAMFSRGLANTTVALFALIEPLLVALKDDDFSTSRFEHLEEIQQRTVEFNDRLVSCSYIAFRDFDLWNAWYRLWVLGAFLGEVRLSSIRADFRSTQDMAVFDRVIPKTHVGAMAPNFEPYSKLFDAAATIVEATKAGTKSTRAATTEIFQLLEGASFIPPMLRMADPSQRHTVSLDNQQRFAFLQWLDGAAPETRAYFGFPT